MILKKIKVKITVGKTKALLNTVKSVIELLYNKLDFSVNSYIIFEKQPMEELDRLVENLIEYEKYRLDKINKKYKKV